MSEQQQPPPLSKKNEPREQRAYLTSTLQSALDRCIRRRYLPLLKKPSSSLLSNIVSLGIAGPQGTTTRTKGKSNNKRDGKDSSCSTTT
jgi:hypothetical protein